MNYIPLRTVHIPLQYAVRGAFQTYNMNSIKFLKYNVFVRCRNASLAVFVGVKLGNYIYTQAGYTTSLFVPLTPLPH